MAGKPAQVQVRGAKEFRKAMKVMGADLRDLTAVNKKAAAVVGVEAVRTAPRESGNLAGSHKVRATRTSGRVTAGTEASGPVPYAGVIHFGWPAHGIEAQPWLWGAAERKESAVVAVYEHEVESLVRKVDLMTPG